MWHTRVCQIICGTRNVKQGKTSLVVPVLTKHCNCFIAIDAPKLFSLFFKFNNGCLAFVWRPKLVIVFICTFMNTNILSFNIHRVYRGRQFHIPLHKVWIVKGSLLIVLPHSKCYFKPHNIPIQCHIPIFVIDIFQNSSCNTWVLTVDNLQKLLYAIYHKNNIKTNWENWTRNRLYFCFTININLNRHSKWIKLQKFLH